MRFLPAAVAVLWTAACTTTADDEFLELQGEYLGQTPPGLNVEMFAPGIVSTGLYDQGIAVAPDGNEIFFHVFVKGVETIITTRMENGRWTKPEIAPFASRFTDGFPSFHPDGSKLFFHSYRALDNSETKADVVSIWYVEKTGAGWGEPKPVPPPVNGNGFVCCPSVTETGTLYYSKKVEGGEEIYRSRYVDGEYTAPERLPDVINSTEYQFHAVISPDESCLVLPLWGRDDAITPGSNYYVSFRNSADTWSDLINLGEAINNDRTGGIPSFSSDGRYFFFEAMSERDFVDELAEGMTYPKLLDFAITQPSHLTGDIYWIGTEYIESLRP